MAQVVPAEVGDRKRLRCTVLTKFCQRHTPASPQPAANSANGHRHEIKVPQAKESHRVAWRLTERRLDIWATAAHATKGQAKKLRSRRGGPRLAGSSRRGDRGGPGVAANA